MTRDVRCSPGFCPSMTVGSAVAVRIRKLVQFLSTGNLQQRQPRPSWHSFGISIIISKCCNMHCSSWSFDLSSTTSARLIKSGRPRTTDLQDLSLRSIVWHCHRPNANSPDDFVNTMRVVGYPCGVKEPKFMRLERSGVGRGECSIQTSGWPGPA